MIPSVMLRLALLLVSTVPGYCYSKHDKGVMHPKSPNVAVPSYLNFNCTLVQGSPYDANNIYFKIVEQKIPEKYYGTAHNWSRSLVNYPVTEPTLPGGTNFLCFVLDDSGKEVFVNHCHVLADYPPEMPATEDIVIKVFNWERFEVVWSSRSTSIFKVNWTVGWKTRESESFTVGQHAPVLLHKTNGIGRWKSTVEHNFLMDARNKQYMIQINGSNTVGQGSVQSHFMNLNELLKPGPVNDADFTSLKANEISLTWQSPVNEMDQELPLIFELSYSSKYEDMRTLVTKNYFAKLVNLIPYANYSMAIRCQHLQSEKWSDPVTMATTTREAVPGRLPQVTTGSYEVVGVHAETRDLRVYWKKIPEQYRHGILTACTIVTTLHGQQYSQPVGDPSWTSDVLPRQRLDKLQMYITCETREGYNDTLLMNPPALIVIAPQELEPKPPDNVTVIALNDSMVDVFWSWTSTQVLMGTNITVFYCIRTLDSCSGELHWHQFPAGLFTTKITLPPGGLLKNYRFGLSVEVPVGSSGINWVTCVHDIREGVSPPNHVQMLDTSVDKISVGLQRPDCFNAKGHVWAYRLSWCEASQPEAKTCSGVLSSKTVLNVQEFMLVDITDLQPGKYYSISAQSIAANGNSSYSVHELAKTKTPILSLAAICTLAILGIIAVPVIVFGVYSCYRKFIKWEKVPIAPPQSSSEVFIPEISREDDESTPVNVPIVMATHPSLAHSSAVEPTMKKKPKLKKKKVPTATLR